MHADIAQGGIAGRAVAVAGGGIAGLAVARALALRGAQVTLFERAPELRELGAGLQIGPNGWAVLAALGLADPARAASVASEAVVLRSADGAQVTRLDLARFDGRFRLFHRARLLRVLADGARDAGVEIHTGAAVDAVVATPDDLRFEAGGIARRADLLIGAEGLHSPSRVRLNGAAAPFFTQQTAWRAVIPDPGGPAQAEVFMGPGRHLVSYPLGCGERNLVGVVERGDWPHEGWSHVGDPDQMRRDFAGFGGPVPGWLRAVQEAGQWGLFRHPVAARWHDDRTVILGDAAHPTLPFMAQGAVMALEDAWVLAQAVDAPGVPMAQGLAWYQAERRSRCQRIVAAANGNARNYHLSGVMARAAHTVLRLGGRVAPDAALNRFRWLYDVDVTTRPGPAQA